MHRIEILRVGVVKTFDEVYCHFDCSRVERHADVLGLSTASLRLSDCPRLLYKTPSVLSILFSEDFSFGLKLLTAIQDLDKTCIKV